MVDIIITILNLISQIIIIVVVIDTLLSYFLSPFQAIRRFFDQLVQPLLDPIRKIVPTYLNIDFSPFILIVIVQLLNSLVSRVLINIR